LIVTGVQTCALPIFPRMNLPLLVLALTMQQPQDTVVLKPVVVTATRVPVAADLVVSAVTVLRGTDLVAQGIRTVAQALETVPGEIGRASCRERVEAW